MADLSLVERVEQILAASRPMLESPREVAERILAALAEAAGDPEALGSAYTRAYYAQPQTDTGMYLGHHAGLQAVAAAAVTGVRAREVAPLLLELSHLREFYRAWKVTLTDHGQHPANVLRDADAALGGGDRGR